MIKIEKDQFFPADLILVTSSLNGAAFIQTASLDGEKNLKLRNSFKDLIPYNTPEKLSTLKGKFSTDQPDGQLHKFSALMAI